MLAIRLCESLGLRFAPARPMAGVLRIADAMLVNPERVLSSAVSFKQKGPGGPFALVEA